MIWSKSSRRHIADAQRGLRKKVHANAADALANGGALTAEMQSRTRDLSLAALDQILARVDSLAEAFSNASQQTAASAKDQARTALDEFADELVRHPIRSFAIAVALGIAAGLSLRK